MTNWIMLVAGTALGIIALTADLIGIGGYPGFGWKQGVGTVVALVLVVVGAIRIFRREGR